MPALPSRWTRIGGDQTPLTISAWAAPVSYPGVLTITGPSSIALLGPPQVGGDIYIDAPRDAIDVDSCFIARYFTNDGARRVLVQATAVEPQPGMRDLVRGKVLNEPSDAPERDSTRQPVEVSVKGTIGDDGPAVDVRLTDVSSNGIAFEASRHVEPGARLHLTPPGGPAGFVLEVVRRIPGRGISYGGRFIDPLQGMQFAQAVLRADQKRREELGERGDTSATGSKGKLRGMYTRPKDDD